MKILIVGGGGREHAIAVAVAESPKADKISVSYTHLDQSIGLNVFDILILHEGEMTDFSSYEERISERFPVKSAHVYGCLLYTSYGCCGKQVLPV